MTGRAGPAAGHRRAVACVGDNCVDVLRSRGDAEVAGGNAFNVAVALARSARTVSYFGAVGCDSRGDLVLEAARAAGVEVSGVERRPGSTGVTIVEHALDGERRFAHEDYGVAAEYRLGGVLDDLAGHRWIHLARQPDYSVLAERIRRTAGDDGLDRTRLSYDAGDHTPPDELARIARNVDILFISATAPDEDPRRIAENALAAGAPVVVVTCGARGAVTAMPGRYWSQPALPVARVVDTLGAGDAFIAGFISSLLDDDELPRALRAGAAAGAAAVAREPELYPYSLEIAEVSP